MWPPRMTGYLFKGNSAVSPFLPCDSLAWLCETAAGLLLSPFLIHHLRIRHPSESCPLAHVFPKRTPFLSLPHFLELQEYLSGESRLWAFGKTGVCSSFLPHRGCMMQGVSHFLTVLEFPQVENGVG